MSIFTAPQWVNSFYSKFPLVVLEQEDTLDWKQAQTVGSVQSPYTLWVPTLPAATFPHARSWASSIPACLRAQLLFLLRSVPIQIRPWVNEDAAPGGKLPALHILSENRLVSAEEIRPWLDNTHPLSGPGASLHGMPNQKAYDSALAVAQLVLARLLPALLASAGSKKALTLLMAEPPALTAGLTTPLPASLTGDDRVIDREEIIAGGIEAIDALQAKLAGSTWALGAEAPSPLDALIASHLYAVYALPETNRLRQHLEESTELGTYVDSVLDFAGRALSP